MFLELKPDAIFTIATMSPGLNMEKNYDHPLEVVFPGQVGAWEKFAAAGIPTIAIRDTPRFPVSIPKCIGSAKKTSDCAFDRKTILPAELPSDLANAPESTVILDLTDGICHPESCEPIEAVA